MSKTYVDNAYNRSRGRVGMDHGTAVISRGTSSSGNTGCSSSFNVGASSSTHNSTYNHEPAPNYYADNPFNRRRGRVGLEHGEAVISPGSSSIKATSRLSDSVKDMYSYEPSLTYSGHPEHEAYAVKEPIRAWENDTRPLKLYRDNSTNRRLGRDGDPVGTAVFPRGSKMSDGTHQETYVDNKMNQKLDRVEMPRGSLPHNPGLKTPTHKANSLNDIYRDSDIGHAISARRSKNKTSQHHKLKTVSSSSSSSDEDVKSTQRRKLRTIEYDNNRSSSSSKDFVEPTQRSNTRIDQHGKKKTDSGSSYEDYVKPIQYVEQTKTDRSRTSNEKSTHSLEKRTLQTLRTKNFLLTDLPCVNIGVREIQIGCMIGQGEYGDVYFGTWYESVVAIKKARIKRATQRRLEMFSEKVINLGKLHHPNIVKTICTCVDSPDLILVMEYIEKKLDDGLVLMNETQRLDILVQISSGLAYLHENDAVHSELKSQNVLVVYGSSDDRWIAKIAGFNLSMIRAETETMMSGKEYQVQNIDTAMYSAPEVLRGETLSLRMLMKADVYSFGLIMFEVMQKHAFNDLSLDQLRKRVERHGLEPWTPLEKRVNKAISDIMKGCVLSKGDRRPDVIDVFDVLENQTTIYR